MLKKEARKLIQISRGKFPPIQQVRDIENNITQIHLGKTQFINFVGAWVINFKKQC
jgi:hypothetical protein